MAAPSVAMGSQDLPVKAAPKPKPPKPDGVPKAGPPVLLADGAVVPFVVSTLTAKAASPPPTPTKAPPVMSTERDRLAEQDRLA